MPASATTIEVRGLTGETKLDALVVGPVVSRLVLAGSGTLRVYSADGVLVSESAATAGASVELPAQGFAVLIG